MGDLDGRLLSAQAVLEHGRTRHVVPACFPFSHTPGMTVRDWIEGDGEFAPYDVQNFKSRGVS